MSFSITIFYALFTTLISCGAIDDSDKAVGLLDEKKNIIVNLETARTQLIKYLGDDRVKRLNFNDVKIHPAITVGDKINNLYFIQFSNAGKDQQLAKFVWLQNGKFYFHEDIEHTLETKVNEENVTFYNSYYYIKGSSKDECLPNIAFLDGELFWITGTELICAPDSPCKSEQIVVM